MSTATLRAIQLANPVRFTQHNRTNAAHVAPMQCTPMRQSPLRQSAFTGIPLQGALSSPGHKSGRSVSLQVKAIDGAQIAGLVTAAIPVVTVGSMLWFMMRNQPNGAGGNGGRPDINFSFEQAKSNVKFDDVAGIEEAKQDLAEVVEFLRNPERFSALGAKIPRGVLLQGPPGTGKTLLAKAVAGEAGVPFFAVSASEFIEMYVGVGAKRVRELFKKARENSPCIIFIDELDAVAQQRGSGGANGGNEERDQTINQLLTEMDGFKDNSGVIVIAATNRLDRLDTAVTRPGRFDRQVQVPLPDVAGRQRILETHSRGKPLADDVDLGSVARRTAGLSGADLANLLNEAAIFAARVGKVKVTATEVDEALERVSTGPGRKVVVSERQKRLVACHEAGHALVGYLLPRYDLVKKVTIIPRGQAGGLTWFEPSEERATSGMYTREYMEDALAVALGGRIAEETLYGKRHATTGASSDLQRSTDMARAMVERFGFNTEVGMIVTAPKEGAMNLGPRVGNEMMEKIDRDIKRLMERAEKRARTIITQHRGLLEKLRDTLVQEENVGMARLEELVKNGIKLGGTKEWSRAAAARAPQKGDIRAV